MPRAARAQARLLQRTTRLVGLTFLVASLSCTIIPGSAPAPLQLAVLPFYALMAVSLYVLGTSNGLRWTILAFAAGIGAIVLLGLPYLGQPTLSTASAATLLATGALPALGIASMSSFRFLGWIIAGYLTSASAVIFSTYALVSPLKTLAVVTVSWGLMAVVGAWLSVSISRALGRIVRLGRAHLAERHASETEAQRRQGARLLHDTVLATLTLLAHSGVGVRPEALREQAAEDARLLRQLRLGGTPMPRSSGGYTLEATETSDLGHTLESVKQRFDRMGLQVSWHGAGRILLPSDVLNAFLLSLGECLENVRRHSGVGAADVTITQDDTTVRAMVTDSGIGFDLDEVDGARLGLAESVIARMHEVGGRTRLFSAPGAGTTVVLEAPK
jgi:signal transduction histidine kinase